MKDNKSSNAVWRQYTVKNDSMRSLIQVLFQRIIQIPWNLHILGKYRTAYETTQHYLQDNIAMLRCMSQHGAWDQETK